MVFSAKIIIDLDYMHFSKDPSIKCLLQFILYLFIYFLKRHVGAIALSFIIYPSATTFKLLA